MYTSQFTRKTFDKEPISSFEFSSELGTIFEVCQSGRMVVSSFDDSRMRKEMSCFTDFSCPNITILKTCLFTTPFNLFRQTGDQMICCLSSDGRLFFWELNSGRCILSTPKFDIPNPDKIKFIGPLLQSGRRFVYLASKLKSGDD